MNCIIIERLVLLDPRFKNWRLPITTSKEAILWRSRIMLGEAVGVALPFAPSPPTIFGRWYLPKKENGILCLDRRKLGIAIGFPEAVMNWISFEIVKNNLVFETSVRGWIFHCPGRNLYGIFVAEICFLPCFPLFCMPTWWPALIDALANCLMKCESEPSCYTDTKKAQQIPCSFLQLTTLP